VKAFKKINYHKGKFIMTKNAILKKIRKTLFCTFTFTLILSMFSCSVSDDNDETQSNAAAKNESPILSENNANITPDKSQNNPEQTEKDKNSEKNVTENKEQNKTNNEQNPPEENKEDKNNDNNKNEQENNTENKETDKEELPEKKEDSEIKEKENPDLHVVIYGIGIRGKTIDDYGKTVADSKNKFAILYNQTENEIDISNWKIKKSTFNTDSKPESTFNIPENTKIGTKQYLLLTRDGYNPEMWSGDVSSDISIDGKFSFSTAGNHVFLVDASDDVIDRLDYIELSETKQKTYERTCNELYITQKTKKIYETAYIFRTNPDIDTNNSCDDFTSLTINDECILKNSQTTD
jgi:flagellar biosynthesis GTPase FlhF